MEYADLHIHSLYSDGQLTVKEIIEHSVRLNLKAISITDHDTITGTREAIQYRDSYDNIDIIEGIEFSTMFKANEIHILAYMYDINDMELNDIVDKLQHDRMNRAIKIIEKFNSLGIDISLDEIQTVSKSKSIGRPHIARLLKKKNYVKSINEAFSSYLTPGKPCFVKKYNLSTADAIEIIKQSKGIPVLAHPGLIKDQSIINEVLDLGISGIEVYHTKHNSFQQREYYQLCKNNDLLITGGSDCHSKRAADKPFISSVKIPLSYVQELKTNKLGG